MKKPLTTLNLYLPSAAKKREIRKKARAYKKSVSQIVVEHFDRLPDPPKPIDADQLLS